MKSKTEVINIFRPCPECKKKMVFVAVEPDEYWCEACGHSYFPNKKNTPMKKKKTPPQKTRRICCKCGRKRDTRLMEVIDTKHGQYFQAGKEIDLYQCFTDWSGRKCTDDGYRMTRPGGRYHSL